MSSPKSSLCSLTVEIQNEMGLHARPSASFVKAANEFKSDIFVEVDGEKVNGKSIVGLLTLGAACGTKLTISADGPDALDALKNLESLVNNKFNGV